MVRVFIFSSHPLFGQGVERLLCQETGLDIVGWETDVDKAFERIKKPTPAVMRILREGLGIKLVGLNLKDNTLCIYWGEQRVVKSIEDLVKAIEHSPPPLAWRSQADPLLDSGEY
jgi:DNA-binding NarL/FixJ family response regulator